MTAAGATNSPMTPVSGPVPGTIMTPGYARAVAQMAYAWGWPMVNIQSRRLMYAQVPMKGMLGPTPVAPLNELAMLSETFFERLLVTVRQHLKPSSCSDDCSGGWRPSATGRKQTT